MKPLHLYLSTLEKMLQGFLKTMMDTRETICKDKPSCSNRPISLQSMYKGSLEGDMAREIEKRPREIEEIKRIKGRREGMREDKLSSETVRSTTVFSCPRSGCSYAFTSQPLLLKHIRKSHNDLFRQTKVLVVSDTPCQQTTSYGDGHKGGDDGHHPQSKKRSYYIKKRLFCKQCGKGFNLSHTLKTHQRVHHRHHTGTKPFNSEQVNKSLIRVDILKGRLCTVEKASTGRKVPMVSAPCQKTTSYGNGHKGDGDHPQAKTLTRTGETQEGAEQKIPYCRRQTKTGKAKTNPIKKHLICKPCGKRFNLLHMLKKHEHVHHRHHTGEKTFNSEQVDKSFNQLDMLKGQHRLHTVEKASAETSVAGDRLTGPVFCLETVSEPCPGENASPENGAEDGSPFLEQFSSEASTKTQSFDCPGPECTYSFANQDYLENHMKRSHGKLYWEMVWNGKITPLARQETPSPSTTQKPGGTDQAQTIGGQCGETSGKLCERDTRKHIHSGERPFDCNEGDKSSEDLRGRLQPGHAGGKASPVNSVTVDVARCQSSQELFSCGECQYAFSSQDFFHAHLKSSHYNLYRYWVLKQGDRPKQYK